MRLVVFAMLPFLAGAANYSAEKTIVDGVPVVRLADGARHTEVFVAPSMGNNIYSMTVNGAQVIYTSSPSPAGLSKGFSGIPFLEPWANRLDGDAFWANGKEYVLNPKLNNVPRDGNHQPMHGLLTHASDWQVAALHADANGAEVTSRLEFWRHPDWMAQFPFAHTISITCRLRDGALQVETTLENLSDNPMPVSVGFHPYFQIPGVPRDRWQVHIAARQRLKLSNVTIPTGEEEPVAFPDPLTLSGVQLDDVFGSLVRNAQGDAVFSVTGGDKKISVIYGPKYQNAVLYAPPGREYICFEPMSGPTNAFNLAHAGLYKDLQSIPPRGEWRESFRVQPSGF